MFFGGLVCYILNPLRNVMKEEYLENLINTIFHTNDQQ